MPLGAVLKCFAFFLISIGIQSIDFRFSNFWKRLPNFPDVALITRQCFFCNFLIGRLRQLEAPLPWGCCQPRFFQGVWKVARGSQATETVTLLGCQGSFSDRLNMVFWRFHELGWKLPGVRCWLKLQVTTSQGGRGRITLHSLRFKWESLGRNMSYPVFSILIGAHTQSPQTRVWVLPCFRNGDRLVTDGLRSQSWSGRFIRPSTPSPGREGSRFHFSSQLTGRRSFPAFQSWDLFFYIQSWWPLP